MSQQASSEVHAEVLYDVSDAVATLRLNRPHKKNAYTPQMGEQIVTAFQDAMQDDAVKVIIVTGEGDAFCAGVDLDHLKAQMAGEAALEGPRLGEEHLVNDWPLDLADYPKPVIAAINGSAFGVGITMTLGFDVRYVAADAKLGLNFTALGILPGLGSTYHLPRLVGVGKSLEWILSGATLTATQAVEAGLAQKLCAPDQTYADALALALSMAQKHPDVLAAARQGLREGVNSDLKSALQRERHLSAELRRG